MTLRLTFIAFISLALLSCAFSSELVKDKEKDLLTASNLPSTVAVMPFKNETDEPGIDSQVRKAFYNHFSSKTYRDIELPIIDEQIIRLEKSTGKTVDSISPKEICDVLGCTGVIYGKVTEYKKVYAGLYSQLGISTEVWMIDTRTGKEVFRLSDSVHYHGGTIPLSPLSLAMTAVSAAMNVRKIQQIRMINELCYKLNEKIPSPEKIIVEAGPVIREVLTNTKEGPFGKGKVIRVGIEGDKSMIATFDIGNFKRGILMYEKSPGIYAGEYLVLPGDNARDMPIIVSLKMPGGLETRWFALEGLTTIDTAPPPQVTGIKTRGYHDRIVVEWEPLKNIPDLKQYKVMRSESPLSGYTELAVTELHSYTDTTAEPEKTYYYRILAVDMAGNDSDPQDGIKASLTGREPVILTGVLSHDTTLSGSYIIKGEYIVPKGTSLIIDKGATVAFDEFAALIVFGNVTVQGKERPVEFESLAGKAWKAITVDGGTVSLNGFRIRGAKCALHIKNAEGVIENGIVSENEMGILLSGIPSPTIRHVTISSNMTGIEFSKTATIVTECDIFQNRDGVLMKGFSGRMEKNNIFDNTINVYSESLARIDANYLGSVNIEEMRLNNVQVVKIYDAKLPQGRIVDAVSNQYATLAADAREKKSAELAAEGVSYFQQRNYGKASLLFEESIKASPSPTSYYYLALCYQEMKEDEKTMKLLKEGISRFPNNATLLKAYGMALYQKGDEEGSQTVFKEVLRLNPEDRHVKFLMERMGQ